LDTSNTLIGSDLYPAVVSDRVADLFGPRVAEYVNDPAAYFAQHEDDAKIKQGELTADEQYLESSLRRLA
ncbi:hypothetical protein, partial [Bartonella sp. CL29QHWL]|uniref:hypothetical protein n=1 Tax=Bartonella sp. CL29QHWL TaxID=3243522 RepID=UPI0035CEC1B4